MVAVPCRNLGSCFTETSPKLFSATEEIYATWEGTVFMQNVVTKNVSWRKTSKRTDKFENSELTHIAGNDTLSPSKFVADVVLILDDFACFLPLFTVFACRTLVSFFTATSQIVFQCSGDATMRATSGGGVEPHHKLYSM